MIPLLITNQKRTLFSQRPLASILNEPHKNIIFLAKDTKRHYTYIKKPKKITGIRTITAPDKSLKELQRKILKKILRHIKLQPCAYGLGKGKSIIQNAQKHQHNDHLLNIDLKDFFNSVHYSKISRIFLGLGFQKSSATILCKLTTIDYHLPQGAPTSPILSSLALLELDNKLSKLCSQNTVTYTRYFDDLSFSANKDLKLFKSKVIKLIHSMGYRINKSKCCLYEKHEKKIVTGVTIIPSGKLTSESYEIILSKILKLQRTTNIDSIDPRDKNILLGQIEFISSINKKDGGILKNEYSKI